MEEEDDNEEEEEGCLDFNEEALEVKSLEDEEESELAGLVDPEEDTRHVVELPKLPTSVWKGHCFRWFHFLQTLHRRVSLVQTSCGLEEQLWSLRDKPGDCFR